MKLFSRARDTSGPKPNRKVIKKTAEPPKNAKTRAVKGGKGASTKRRIQRSGFMQALRRVGFVFWPERYPDLMAERAKRLAEQQAPRGFIWVWALSVVLSTAAFTWHLNVRFEIIQTGYALSRAQGEQRRLRLSQRELRLEMATLKEPGRIEAQAREELGMDRPDHERIIRLDGPRRGPRLARRGRGR